MDSEEESDYITLAYDDNQSPAKGIIRPIAFKPVVVSNQNYVNTRHFPERKQSAQDDGYGSQDYPITNHNAANMSHGSVQMDSDRSTSFSGESAKQYSPERPESMNSSSVSHVSSVRVGMEGYIQTPSPSDSGVGELEAMLREKDAEINTLREVMDKNERAIFQVYEDKKKSWNKELKELHDEYEQKLRLQQRKSYKTEQTMSLQVYKLHQEKKSLNEELEKLKTQYETIKCTCDSYETDNERLRSQLANSSVSDDHEADVMSDLQQQVDLLNQSLSEKTQETLDLQKQLDEQKVHMESQDKEISEKFREILAKTEEVKSLRANLRRYSNENEMDVSVSDSSLNQSDTEIQMDQSKLSSPVSDLVKTHTRMISQSCTNTPSGRRSRSSSANSKTSSPLRAVDIKDGSMENVEVEIRKLRAQLEEVQDNFEKEKEQWLDEKNKVIRYQKQLQLNYVQMYNKNKMLEAEVEQLTLELESRDLKLMALNGGEESVC
ncbi:hypothetical protein FSP39_015871 [Pinctada imbricata]|uniref:Uncharacterized protein n=1 Tax=Pinctada imbricata TaxID=66713 RepID=A0AA89C1J0_PINIB|nr:hypothetical protein FSP39_015871 [Pinctada imbricata]